MALPGFTAAIFEKRTQYSFAYGRISERSSLSSSNIINEPYDRPTYNKIYMNSQMTDQTSRAPCPPCTKCSCSGGRCTQECYKWNDSIRECVNYTRTCHPHIPVTVCEAGCFCSRVGRNCACVQRCRRDNGPWYVGPCTRPGGCGVIGCTESDCP